MKKRYAILIIILVVAIMGLVIAITIKKDKNTGPVKKEDNVIEEKEKPVDEDDHDTTIIEEDDDSEQDDDLQEPDDSNEDEEGTPDDKEYEELGNAKKEDSDNTDKSNICQLLKSKGFNNEQVAAIMANMRNESNFNSKACGDYNGNTPTSFGLLLWHNNRFNELIKFSGETKDYKAYNGDYCKKDYPFSTVDMQINFLERELNTSYARVKEMLEQDKTVKELIFDFCKYYVVPAGSDIVCDSRSLQANEIYDYVTNCQ